MSHNTNTSTPHLPQSTHTHSLGGGVEDNGQQFQQYKPVLVQLAHTQLHQQLGVVVNVTLE